MTFQMSGLPEYLHGSWANANKIIELGGICQHPSDPSKYYTRVCAHSPKF